MPKPITQKSQLFGIVLISFIVLGISTLFSLSKEENTETSKACIHELEGKVSVLPSDKNQLVVVDKKGNHYFPVIVGEKTNLTATASAKICYNKIDASNPNHKMIYVEKVVSLPSRNEKR
ncbi:MAG: hypothetical protein RIT36_909 [Bacteroidota bacterium]|jgi:hypothetical protein